MSGQSNDKAYARGVRDGQRESLIGGTIHDLAEIVAETVVETTGLRTCREYECYKKGRNYGRTHRQGKVDSVDSPLEREYEPEPLRKYEEIDEYCDDDYDNDYDDDLQDADKRDDKTLSKEEIEEQSEKLMLRVKCEGDYNVATSTYVLTEYFLDGRPFHIDSSPECIKRIKTLVGRLIEKKYELEEPTIPDSDLKRSFRINTITYNLNHNSALVRSFLLLILKEKYGKNNLT